MWRCVLHGRASSFFRPSESGVREFFGAAVLAGLGSFLGGRFLVWRCVLHGRVSSFFRASEVALESFLALRFWLVGLVSRWCLAVSHLLRRGRFWVWRCVLHGRVSSFFRPSESGTREFFGAAVLAGWGSFLGGVWLFRIC